MPSVRPLLTTRNIIIYSNISNNVFHDCLWISPVLLWVFSDHSQILISSWRIEAESRPDAPKNHAGERFRRLWRAPFPSRPVKRVTRAWSNCAASIGSSLSILFINCGSMYIYSSWVVMGRPSSTASSSAAAKLRTAWMLESIGAWWEIVWFWLWRASSILFWWKVELSDLLLLL